MRVGELWRDEQWMMECLDIDRRQTITDCLNELLEAGAIKRVRRQRRSTITFVDIGWLKKHKRLDATSNEASELAPDNVSSNSTTPNVASKATLNEASKTTRNVGVHNAERGVRVVRSSEVDNRSSNNDDNVIAPQVEPEAKPKPAPATQDPISPEKEKGVSPLQRTAPPTPESATSVLSGLDILLAACDTEELKRGVRWLYKNKLWWKEHLSVSMIKRSSEKIMGECPPDALQAKTERRPDPNCLKCRGNGSVRVPGKETWEEVKDMPVGPIWARADMRSRSRLSVNPKFDN
jgi:hypothetical protein